MRLVLLSESGQSREFMKRLRKANRGTPNNDKDNGPLARELGIDLDTAKEYADGGGPFGIAREFGVDFDTACKYSSSTGRSGGGYGERDIQQKELHRNRAPVNILKLLRYFNVSSANIKKLVDFYLSHREIIKTHMRVPDNGESLRQLYAGERLVSLVRSNRDFEPGYITVPFYSDKIVYVLKRENLPLVQEIQHSHNKLKQDLLRGLVFGYRLVDVFNFVRQDDSDLVDSICGRVE